MDIPSESELFDRFATRIRSFGLRHLRDADATEDLVQDVLITTMERLRAGAIRDLERLPSFVLGTCRMLVSNQKRSRVRRAALLETHGDAARPATPTAPIHPLDAKRLSTCLQELSQKARTVVLLTFYADRSSNEVAEELRMSAENVRIVRHRALQRLRACMGGGAPT